MQEKLAANGLIWFEQIISRRLLAIVERNQKIRENVLKKVDWHEQVLVDSQDNKSRHLFQIENPVSNKRASKEKVENSQKSRSSQSQDVKGKQQSQVEKES